MKIPIRGLWAAVVASALLAAPAAADTVDVRIEGDGVSLARTVEVPETGTFGPDNCPYDTAGGAIEIATEGNWDRESFTQTILGESHTFSENDFWEFWFDRDPSQVGICDSSQPLEDGSQVLMLVQRLDSAFNPTVFPLFVAEAPASVERGQPARFGFVEHVHNSGSPGSTPRPAEGATVAGGGQSATTGPDGAATLTFPEAGTVGVRATGANRTRSDVATVAVTEPGQPAPAPATPQEPAAPCVSDGSDGLCGTRDLQAPITVISSIREGQRFRRGRGPRVLRGTAGVRPVSDAAVQADPSGIRTVKIRLTRNRGGDCAAFSSRRERFVRRRCGARHGWFFRVATRADWRYLLPARLGPGRYVLDAKATDRAFNVDRGRRRGENRVVFRVG